MHRQFGSASSKGANFVLTLRSVLYFRTRVCQSAVTNDGLRQGPKRSDMVKERAKEQEYSPLCSHKAVIAPHYHPVHIFTPNIPKIHGNIIHPQTPRPLSALLSCFSKENGKVVPALN
jgi:hypothetical protein